MRHSVLLVVAFALMNSAAPGQTTDASGQAQILQSADATAPVGAPENQDPPQSIVRSTPEPTSPDSPSAGGGTSTSSSPDSEPGALESSLYSSFFMAGKTQDQFMPFTPEERLKAYALDLFGPFHILMAGAQAGITQWQNVPHEWGQGAEGYGKRFGNYYAYAATSAVLQMIGEDILHEDNFYYGSGEHGVWKRVKYAVKSSVMARGADGTQHFSISQVGSTAGAAFISRLWQPRSQDTAGDGATSFGISMATNAGVNVLREFMPDIARHIFRRGEQSGR